MSDTAWLSVDEGILRLEVIHKEKQCPVQLSMLAQHSPLKIMLLCSIEKATSMMLGFPFFI